MGCAKKVQCKLPHSIREQFTHLQYAATGVVLLYIMNSKN